jgi:hypothetical protein
VTGHALLAGALGFGAYAAAVAVLLRAIHRWSPALVVTTTSVGAYLATVGVAAGMGRRVLFWPLSASYWFLALCFLMAFGAIYKSISLRILLDLLDRPDRSESYEAIHKRYVQHESYQDRLQILLAEGLATRECAGFQLTRKGRRLAAIAHAVQRFFGIERSG